LLYFHLFIISFFLSFPLYLYVFLSANSTITLQLGYLASFKYAVGKRLDLIETSFCSLNVILKYCHAKEVMYNSLSPSGVTLLKSTAAGKTKAEEEITD
jgi:hypothetical protein